MNYKGYQIVREELVELGTGIRSHQWAVYIGGCPLGSDYRLRVFDTLKRAKEYINNKQTTSNMNKQVKVTALTEEGGSIESGWFNDVNKGEEYADAMTARGYVVVKQYR